MIKNKDYANFPIPKHVNLGKLTYDWFGKYYLLDKILAELHTEFFIVQC
jgi:hypothetical protein